LSNTRKLPAGSVVFARTHARTDLVGVSTGTVKVTAPPLNGRKATVQLLQAGQVFGDFALLHGEPLTIEALAMTDCELTVIKRSDFQKFLHDEPKVAFELVEVLSTDLCEATFTTLSTRLARVLLRLSGKQSISNKRKTINITQIELSKLLGATRESINKTIREFKSRTWVSIERGSIRVLAPAALRAIARGGDVDSTKI
jgi:CRP/FNR family transcriptional regulator, cyclic AMP receptor protein